MNPTPDNSLRPWTQAWLDYQRSALGESACRQLGFYVIPENLLVSVVIPIHNEEQTLAAVVRKVAEVPIRKELILVDDASTDDSLEIALELIETLGDANNQIRVESLKINQGKGAAIRTGFDLAQGEIVLIQDADLEYDPDEIIRLIQPIVEQQADVVFGSRFLGGQSRRAGYFWNYVGNRCLTTLSNMFTNLKLTDMETGYKAFHRRVIDTIAPQLTETGFAIEPELTARVARANFRVYEVPIEYTGRTYEEGKKIRFWRDGLEAVLCILKFGLRIK